MSIPIQPDLGPAEDQDIVETTTFIGTSISDLSSQVGELDAQLYGFDDLSGDGDIGYLSSAIRRLEPSKARSSVNDIGLQKPESDANLLLKIKVYSDRKMTKLVGTIDLSNKKQWKYFKGLLVSRQSNEKYASDPVLSSLYPKTLWIDPYTINKMMNDLDPDGTCLETSCCNPGAGPCPPDCDQKTLFDGFSQAFNCAPVNVSFLQWLDDTGNSGSIGIDTRFYTESIWYQIDKETGAVQNVDVYSQVVPSYSEVGGQDTTFLLDRRKGGYVSADVQISGNNEISGTSTAKSFVTNYRTDKYVNSIPYAASIVAGKSNQFAASLNSSVIAGNDNRISGVGSANLQFVFGLSNTTEAAGVQTSMVVGRSNVLSSGSNSTYVFGQQNVVKAQNSIVFGGQNTMSGVDNSIALGLSNIISAANAQHIPTIALGGCSVVSSAGAFVWNTIDQKGSATISKYGDHGSGSFNVNPATGLSGFYIGESNFIECVVSAIQTMSEQQKTALRAALGL